MKKNNLVPNKGLSLSQAQSISNLCNQRATEIAKQLMAVNNYTKTVNVEGKDHETVKGVKLPDNVVILLQEKAKLHACQAFLMENMKAKENLLNVAKNIAYTIPDGLKSITPEKPKFVYPVILSQVNEEFGWEQLTASEYNEYLEAEAYASHIGQFIHERSILAGLRNEINNIPSVEWMVIKGDGTKTPVEIKVHHTSEQLLKIHEELAALHRNFEQKVNYYKAKVKNLTTEENARIAKLNADAQNSAEKTNNDLQLTYDTTMKKHHEALNTAKAEFEKDRQTSIKEIASMRIEIDPRFQEIINTFLNQLPKQE
jgi:hypothetical protein